MKGNTHTHPFASSIANRVPKSHILTIYRILCGGGVIIYAAILSFSSWNAFVYLFAIEHGFRYINATSVMAKGGFVAPYRYSFDFA